MKASQVGREQDLRKRGLAPRKQAPAAAARTATASIEATLSLIPGRSGQQRTPALRPAMQSLRSAAKRRSGRGARGSSLRANAASVVVMVR